MHRDNVGLREIMRQGLPLVYLHGVVKGKYLATWPVYIVGDDPVGLSVQVAVDDPHCLVAPDSAQAPTDQQARRRYVTATVRQRVHQRTFRERVLAAYRKQCALCRLKHVELLDAAHIVPDTDAEGEPIVQNGLSMCKLHHAAFDRNIIGVRPDCVVEVRHDILDEINGPMLRHGLQQMHGVRIHVPRSPGLQPHPDRLAKRYELFKKTA